MYYPCSENKGADQLRSYREADLRLCFRICRLFVFPCGGSYIIRTVSDLTSRKYIAPVVRKSESFTSEIENGMSIL